MANKFDNLKTQFGAFLASTKDIDNTTKQELRDFFVEEYRLEWDALIEDGQEDNETTRMEFLLKKTFDYWKGVYEPQARKQQIRQLPASKKLR